MYLQSISWQYCPSAKSSLVYIQYVYVYIAKLIIFITQFLILTQRSLFSLFLSKKTDLAIQMIIFFYQAILIILPTWLLSSLLSRMATNRENRELCKLYVLRQNRDLCVTSVCDQENALKLCTEIVAGIKRCFHHGASEVALENNCGNKTALGNNLGIKTALGNNWGIKQPSEISFGNKTLHRNN